MPLTLCPYIWRTLNSLGRGDRPSVPAYRHLNVMSACHAPVIVSGDPVNTDNGLEWDTDD